MSINRTLQPEIQDIKNIVVPQGKKIETQNGVPIYFVQDAAVSVIKVEFIFEAGYRVQSTPYIATAANSLLPEGTEKHSSLQLAEALDYYGAYLQNRTSSDDANLTLFCHPKHLASCLPYIVEILTEANYPQKEIDTQKQNAIQRLLVNETKTGFLARRKFHETVFGKENPYGTFANQEDIQNISRETLLNFYENNYKNRLKYIMVSGGVNDAVLSEVSTAVKDFSQQKGSEFNTHPSPKSDNKIHVQKSGAMQSTIRIGREMFNRAHPDFRKMQVLNLALGGYFGSRLMTNIREEKGLTYGIYSALESYLYGGCFYVETDLNNNLVEVGLKEIYKEIADLREKPIPETELKTVKSYMLGSFLRSLDGVFHLADRYRILIDYGFDYGYYKEFVETIKSVSALELQELANKYLQEKDLYEIVAGEK